MPVADSLNWWWLDRSGVQRVATTDQIRVAIEDGRMPADSLVFRAGMAAFLPACSVAFFSDLKAPSAYQARPDATELDPPGVISAPTPEVSAALRKTMKGTGASGTLIGHAPTAPPPTSPPEKQAPSAQSKATSRYPAARPATNAPPQPRPSAYPPHGRPSFHPVPPSGLHPVPPSGAIPPIPPPAMIPDFGSASHYSERPEPAQTLTTPPSTPAAIAASTLSQPPPASAPGLVHFDLEMPEDQTAQSDVHVPPRRANPQQEPNSRVILPVSDRDLPTPSLPRPALGSLPVVVPMNASPKWLLPAAAIVGGLGIIGLVAFIFLNNRTKPKPATSVDSAPSAVATSTPSALVVASISAPSLQSSAPLPQEVPPIAESKVPCRLTLKATRIVSKASRNVPIETGALEDGSLAAAGFSTDEYNAFGVVVDTTTLRLKRSSFDKRMTKPVRRVVPIVSGDQIDFEVDVDSSDAVQQDPLTIPASPPIKLGWFQDSLTVTSESSPVPAVLWKKPADKNAEAMRGISIPSKGTSVTFRVKDGIYLGSMDQKYDPQGALNKIAGTGVKVGTPSIGWNGRDLMVAFADLESETGGWKIRFARSRFGKTPKESETWIIPDGGPGGEAMAPSILGQPDGRWLFVWTEGSTGKRDVRARTYDAEMNPLGEAMTISPQGANAGQGIIAMAGSTGAIFYLSLVGANYEVWATAIACPREE